MNENPTASIIRKRSVGDGFHEDVAILNHGDEPLTLDVRLEPDGVDAHLPVHVERLEIELHAKERV